MTATLSTRAVIPTLGSGEREIEVDYSYNQRHRELVIECAVTRVNGAETPVWHLLSSQQRDSLEDACRVDYQDRMDQADVDRRALRDGD